MIFSKNVSFSQDKNPYPNSIIDIGLGIGTNYGIMGGQAIIGKQGSGALLAYGWFDGRPAYQFGLQASVKWFFFNLCYGVYGSAHDYYTKRTVPLKGFIVVVGGKINLHKSKLLFLELGAGYSTGAEIIIPGGTIPVNNFSGVVGIGYRIAFKKKTQD